MEQSIIEFIDPLLPFDGLTKHTLRVTATFINVVFSITIFASISYTTESRSFTNTNSSNEFDMLKRWLVDTDIFFSMITKYTTYGFFFLKLRVTFSMG